MINKVKTTICVPVHNVLFYTKQFVESVKENTKIPYKLLFLDNGSTDGTKDYLKSEKIDTITEKENTGVVKAWNKLIDNCDTEYICIMNNDIVVTPYWLTAMEKVLDREENIYCVQPHTTNDKLPIDFPNNYYPRAEIQKSERMFGWCFMLRMKIFDIIGKFDEEFDMAWYEDRDFNNRLNENGFYPHTVLSSYIHHFQNRTLWTVDGIEEKMAENEIKYQEKWGEINKLNNNMSNKRYKISNPINFPDPPDGCDISKGQAKYYDHIPAFAKDNPAFVIEKLSSNAIIKDEEEKISEKDIASEIKRKHKQLKEDIIKDNLEKEALAGNTKAIRNTIDRMQEKKIEVYECEICAREFTTKRGLTMHKTRMHKDK